MYLVGVVGVDGNERVHVRVLVEAQQPEAVEVRGALVALVDQHQPFPAPIQSTAKKKKKKCSMSLDVKYMGANSCAVFTI